LQAECLQPGNSQFWQSLQDFPPKLPQIDIRIGDIDGSLQQKFAVYNNFCNVRSEILALQIVFHIVRNELALSGGFRPSGGRGTTAFK
jgi:hypothetical protein